MRVWLVRLTALLLLLGIAATAFGPRQDVAAQAGAAGQVTTTVVLRAASVEALPLLVALRSGVADELGLALQLERSDGNPVEALSGPTPAAIGTSVDLFRQPKRNVVEVFNFYQRAPVALVADTSLAQGGLDGLVIAAPADGGLADRLARDIKEQAPGATLVPGGGAWFPSLANYAIGQVDAVLAPAPLPHYLALRRGAVVWDASEDTTLPPVGAGSLFVLDTLTPATRERLVEVVRRGTQLLAERPDQEIVDLVLADFPLWEPDAVLEMVRVAQRSLNPNGQVRLAALQHAAQLTGVSLDPELARRLGATRE